MIKMVLYKKIKQEEEHIAKLEQTSNFLRENGFEVYGDFPNLEEEARRLLENEEYQDNPVIKRMRTGERLNEIVDEILSHSTYNLKFSKQKRGEYNKEISNLCGVVPILNSLRRGSIFSIDEPESLILLTTSVLALSGGAISRALDFPEEVVYRYTWLCGVVGAIYGGVIGLLSASGRKKHISEVKDKAEYIDNLLEG